MERGDWHSDARAVGVLRLVLALGDADPGRRPTPEERADLASALATTRDRLRRRLLLAEGLTVEPDPPGA